MNCSHCQAKKTQKQLNQVEVRVAGNVLNVTVCCDCKESLQKVIGYASAFPTPSKPAAQPAKKQARQAHASVAKRQAVPQPAFKRDDKKFDSYALSEDEIKRTQQLRPAVRVPDTPRKRQIDDVDKIKSGQRCRVFCMAATPSMRGGREKKILGKAMAELGTSNVRCIKDDGFEAVFEAA